MHGFKSVHSWLLLFYSMYVLTYIYILYQKDHFVPTDFGQKKRVIGRPLHTCFDTKVVLLQCIKEHGRQNPKIVGSLQHFMEMITCEGEVNVKA